MAKAPNNVPIADITSIRGELHFEDRGQLSGEGIRLAQSLQTPGFLTPESVELLRARAPVIPPIVVAEPIPDRDSRVEGEDIWSEQKRRKRNPVLTQRRLERDGFTCRHCGFSRTDIAPHIGSALILHVHHLFPFRDTEGTRVSRLEDLVTLCPTCHSIVHALATVYGAKRLGLGLLRRYLPK